MSFKLLFLLIAFWGTANLSYAESSCGSLEPQLKTIQTLQEHLDKWTIDVYEVLEHWLDDHGKRAEQELEGRTVYIAKGALSRGLLRMRAEVENVRKQLEGEIGKRELLFVTSFETIRSCK